MQEARELANDPCTDYTAAPLEVCTGSLKCNLVLNGLATGRYFCESLLAPEYSASLTPRTGRNGIALCVVRPGQSLRVAYTIFEFCCPPNTLSVPLQL